MDNAIRLQYLEAMGIDVWVSRHRPVVADQVFEESESVGYPQGRKWAEPSEAHRSHPDERSKNLDGWASLHSAQPTTLNSHPWTDLQHDVSECKACQLCETRTQTVFGVGSHHASWMLIGEAPGQNEDLQGEPFVGRAGQLLNEMLRAIGLRREEVFIANILKCRPPNNRDPQAGEVDACHDFLQRQIALLKPKIILAVGRIAAQNLLKTQQPLARLRGVQHQLDNIPLIVVHHPAYLLRTLTEKAKAWDDLQFAVSVYQSLEQ